MNAIAPSLVNTLVWFRVTFAKGRPVDVKACGTIGTPDSTTIYVAALSAQAAILAAQRQRARVWQAERTARYAAQGLCRCGRERDCELQRCAVCRERQAEDKRRLAARKRGEAVAPKDMSARVAERQAERERNAELATLYRVRDQWLAAKTAKVFTDWLKSAIARAGGKW